MINNPYDNYITKGWQCPVCGRVNAPNTPFCYCNSNKKQPVVMQFDPKNIKEAEDFFKEYFKPLMENYNSETQSFKLKDFNNIPDGNYDITLVKKGECNNG